jgi:hypothetical protein
LSNNRVKSGIASSDGLIYRSGMRTVNTHEGEVKSAARFGDELFIHNAE